MTLRQFHELLSYWADADAVTLAEFPGWYARCLAIEREYEF